MTYPDPTTRALLSFLGIEAEHTRRVVIVLEAGKLPRVHVTKQIHRRAGSETAALLSRTRTFDLVPTDGTKKSFAAELASISLDLERCCAEDSAAIDVGQTYREGNIVYVPDVAIPREPT